MKKILVAFDGQHYSEGALSFASRLNEMEPILLTGAFMPQINFANLWSYSGGGIAGRVFVPLVEDEDVRIVQENMERFRSYCTNNNIEYRLHKDFFDFAVPELKKESRFADLLIISSETFYNQLRSGEPNDYLEEVLYGVECPVVVLPEHFNFPESNILAYDGSASSVHAIKQFAYILRELVPNETVLVHIEEKEGEVMPDAANVQELISRHFPNLALLNLQADPHNYFRNWLKEKRAPILVCGSYGRPGMSRLFRKSFVAGVIKDHKVPVFIAHRK